MVSPWRSSEGDLDKSPTASQISELLTLLGTATAETYEAQM